MLNAPLRPSRSGGPGRTFRCRLLVLPLAAVGMLSLLSCGPPPPDEADLARIERLLKGDDYALARKDAAELLGKFPESAEARALHGLTLMRAGEIAAAEAEFRRSLEIDPDCAEAHLGQGRIAYGRNKLDLALTHFTEAASSGRFSGEAREEAARIHAERGEFVPALELTRAASEEMDYLKEDRLANMKARLEYYRSLGAREYMILPEAFERTTVPLLGRGQLFGSPIQRIEVRINGEGPWPVDIDTAARNEMTLSKQLADRLDLERAGEFPALGVGGARQTLEGSWVQRVEIGDLSIENVPVMVMDSPTFQGEERGLIGTGLLKRFNCTIDVADGSFTLYAADRTDLLEEAIDPSRVVSRIPLFIAGGPLVLVGVEGSEARPFLVDTAASVMLLDERYFEERIRPSVDPNALAWSGVTGIGGTAQTMMIPSATVTLGGADVEGVRLVVYDMEPMSRLVRRYAAGILGAPVLWRYRVHLDFSEPAMVLESYKGAS